MEELLEKTGAYLDYINEHYSNVLRAWKVITSREFGETSELLGFRFKFLYIRTYEALSEMIDKHDSSKMSVEEFVPYRRNFYPTEEDLDINGILLDDVKKDFKKAWKHHKENNDHHWEVWTKTENNYLQSVHNFVDWFAMSLARGNKPLDYYRANKKRIKLPKETILMFNQIEECLIEMGFFE